VVNFTQEEYLEAQRAMTSLLSKMEKVILKLNPGTSQHTLTLRRIDALKISVELIQQAIQKT